MPAKINVLSHPLVNTRLAKLRQVSTSSKEFREVTSIASVFGGLAMSLSTVTP
jgi:uracil phosphoribosyltransferase